MKTLTDQERHWASDFGETYTDRNEMDLERFEHYYKETYGQTRFEMNSAFLSELDKNANILEVGCNIGNQLLFLQSMGFNRLSGGDIQQYALDKAKAKLPDVCLRHMSGNKLPFNDDEFDLVFTSGVLIHIAPDSIISVLAEMVRCSKRYIWGFEYYSDNLENIEYRGNHDLLWKTNFSKLFTDNFDNLRLVKEEKFDWVNSSNICTMYLLEKY